MFVYILTAVVVGLIFILGAKWLIMIFAQARMTELLMLKTDVEEAFEGLKYGYGDWVNAEFHVPDKIEKICFFDSKMGKDGSFADSNLCRYENPEFDSYLCDVWEYGENGAAIDTGEIDFEISGVIVRDGGYLCLDSSSGLVNVRLMGTGDAVVVSRVS